MDFFYQARDQKGLARQGHLVEFDEQAVFQLLKKKGWLPTLIRPTRSVSFQSVNLFERITLVDRINFTKQLSVMVRSGLPIVDALATIEDQTNKRKIKQIVRQITQAIKSGSSLSAALASQPLLFSELYVALIESGEKSGHLEDVLERLGQNLEKDHEVTTKVKGALYYPAFILTVMAIVMFIIFSYVLPQLKTIFTDVGVTLPLMTRILLAVGDFFGHYKYLILVGLFGLIIVLRLALKTQAFKNFWDIVQLKIPIFGPFYQQVYNERFCRTLSSLIFADLPMLDILKTIRRVLVNHLYQEMIDQVTAEVEAGATLSEALKNQNRLPGVIGNMTAIGEKTGQIAKVVGELSNYYEREIDQMAKNFTTLLEPLIMVLIGVGVGLMVASVIVPIYNLISAA